ncbi:hypothetical protein AB3S75_009758 [Citrus x aurantiifolia]
MASANHPVKGLYFAVVGAPQSFSDNYKLHGKAKGFCSSRRWLHRFSEAEIMR